MIRRQWSWVLGLLAAVAICRPVVAAEPSPEEVLRANGLRKLNQYFVLADESQVNSKFRELDLLHRKVADAQQKASAAEKKVEDKKKLIIASIQQQRELNAALATTTSLKLHNKLVLMHNELVDRVSLLERSDAEEKAAAAARAAVAVVSEQYIEGLLKARAQLDQADEQYTALADDAKVRQAIEDFNKGRPSAVKLGPTPAFALLDRKLKKLESGVLSETIAMQRGDGNLWHVTVSLNGKHAQEMAVDTGASVIALPYQVAEAAGMTPSATDPTVRVSLADGHVISAKRVFAASVRLGKFTVEHVECAVMPADLTQAQPLLGLSFFKHFTYKIDSAKGKLAISQIEQAEKGGGTSPLGPSRATWPIVPRPVRAIARLTAPRPPWKSTPSTTSPALGRSRPPSPLRPNSRRPSPTPRGSWRNCSSPPATSRRTKASRSSPRTAGSLTSRPASRGRPRRSPSASARRRRSPRSASAAPRTATRRCCTGRSGPGAACACWSTKTARPASTP